MNKTFKTVIITSVVTFLITNLFYGIIYKPYKNDVVAKVATINNIIQEYGFYDVDEKVIADYAASGLALAVNDKYTNYYSTEQFEQFLNNLTNGSYVIGISVTVNEQNQLIVGSVVEDSPAQKAGVKVGDIILEIDSIKYSGDELEDAVSVMRGEGIENILGTSLELKILRGSSELNISIVREKINYQSVKSNMINKSVGYIRITAFNGSDTEDENSKDTYDEFVQHLEGLNNSGMKKLIIDLRNNPGGNLDVVNNIADELLPKGTIMYTEDKHGKKTEYKSDQEALDIPIVVLVNSQSASGSEVLTGALRDYKRATIIGTKTFGKGVVQTVIPLNDGSGISITTSKYFTPNGVCIHDVGIEPDVVIEADIDFDISQNSQDDDIQLQKAIEIINDF